MAVNKVIYGGNTLVDLTEDSVTPANLLHGATAHNASGEQIVGSMVPVGGVESWNGRTGSVMPIGGDYNDSQIILSSTMHIGGETQTNVSEALTALLNNGGGSVMVNNEITGRSTPLHTITISDVDLEDGVSELEEGQIYIYIGD